MPWYAQLEIFKNWRYVTLEINPSIMLHYFHLHYHHQRIVYERQSLVIQVVHDYLLLLSYFIYYLASPDVGIKLPGI